ncbi:MAG: HNH endonuclease [Planctomycetota bacterium]|nr:MAG: HNH endonuclease [Planctomycetota bacterium]
MSRVSRALRRRVRRRARGLCEYCNSCPELTGHDFTVDHVIPESRGGLTRMENLCWCCFWCNAFKQARTQAADRPARAAFQPTCG